MKVTVKLFATLRKGRFETSKLELEEEMNAGKLINFLKISEDAVSIIFINGIHGDMESIIKDGDIVALFPPVGGG